MGQRKLAWFETGKKNGREKWGSEQGGGKEEKEDEEEKEKISQISDISRAEEPSERKTLEKQKSNGKAES